MRRSSQSRPVFTAKRLLTSLAAVVVLVMLYSTYIRSTRVDSGGAGQFASVGRSDAAGVRDSSAPPSSANRRRVITTFLRGGEEATDAFDYSITETARGTDDAPVDAVPRPPAPAHVQIVPAPSIPDPAPPASLSQAPSQPSVIDTVPVSAQTPPGAADTTTTASPTIGKHPKAWKGLRDPAPWPLEANTGGCDGWYGNGYAENFSLLPQSAGGHFQCYWHTRHRTQFCVAGKEGLTPDGSSVLVVPSGRAASGSYYGCCP